MAQSLVDAAWNDKIARISATVTLVGLLVGVYDAVGYFGGGSRPVVATSLIQPPSLSVPMAAKVVPGSPGPLRPPKPVNPDALVPSLGGNNPPPGSRDGRWDEDDWGTVKRRQ